MHGQPPRFWRNITGGFCLGSCPRRVSNPLLRLDLWPSPRTALIYVRPGTASPLLMSQMLTSRAFSAGAWPLETDEQGLPTGRFTAVEAHLDVRLVPAARPAVLENAMKMFTSPSPGRRSSRVQAPCALWQHWCSSPLNLERLRRASACLACRSSISAGERATSRAVLPGHRRCVQIFVPPGSVLCEVAGH